ncbi:hypothetical protein GA0115240_176830 [Streptomyces sp. DvalAA-14]|nr:hypothetical protein [Streptomyces sp. SID4948]SCE53474.1 hypothetical protein GA0115240_176830 [Streptomyces sp. DvalAA-14]
MTNAPGSESPGSSSDSPEPVDGQSPAPAPPEPSGPPTGTVGPPHWAPRQPPPVSGWGGWVPPPGGPQSPGGETPRWGHGWGNPPSNGWQQGPWIPRQAPKPGVIPLRPLDVGDIVGGAFATLRLHWRALLTATFAIALVSAGASVVIQGLFLDDTRIKSLRDNSDPSARDILHSTSGAFAGIGLTSLVTLIGTVFATGMLALVTSRSVLGRQVTARALWRDARPRLPQLLGLTLLIAVALYGVIAVATLPGVLIAVTGSENGGAALGSLGLLGGSIVAIWLWGQWSLAAPALMLEKQSAVAALKRSAKLVGGTWWRVLGIQILGLLIAGVLSAVITIPFDLIAAAVTSDSFDSLIGSDSNPSWTYLLISGAGQVIASTITLSISAGVTALLYMDQRIRRESLDIELLRAAAAPTKVEGKP